MNWFRLFCAAVIIWQAVTSLPFDPTPVVVPPDIPVVVPVEQGQRTIILIRETEDETPAFARLVVALRNGEHAAYLTGKGHTLRVYDQHQLDENGEPLAIVQTLLPLHSELPAVFILREDGLPLHHETLPATATAADVMAILKGQGG